jgi:hypothetical protein
MPTVHAVAATAYAVVAAAICPHRVRHHSLCRCNHHHHRRRLLVGSSRAWLATTMDPLATATMSTCTICLDMSMTSLYLCNGKCAYFVWGSWLGAGRPPFFV